MTDVQDTPVAPSCLANKICPKCNIDKPISEFGLHAKRKDGYQYWCRQCVNSYYQKNRDKAIQRSNEWYIKNIDYKKVYDKQYRKDNYSKIREKEKLYYENNKGKAAEYREKNKEIITARKKAWYNANKERLAAYRKENKELRANHNRKYRASDPLRYRRYLHVRRTRLSATNENYESGYIKILLKLQRGKCALCRCLIKSCYHVDHIKPISKGGTNGKYNIQLLCPTCNLTKNASDPIDFMQSRGFLL